MWSSLISLATRANIRGGRFSLLDDPIDVVLDRLYILLKELELIIGVIKYTIQKLQ